MEAVFILGFVALCGFGMLSRPLAFSIALLMHPLEQVMQAHAPVLRTTAIGSKAVNIAVGLTVLVAVVRGAISSPNPLRGWMTTTWTSTVLLFLWSIFTLVWSPGREAGIEIVLAQFPFFLVLVGATPLLIHKLDDLTRSMVFLLTVGSSLCLIAVMSPEFSTYRGRLGLDLGAGIRSNPLAIGELGGTVLILAACLRRGLPDGTSNILRLLGVVVGAMLALQSGSRGQFLFAAVIAVGFFPVSAPLRSFAGFFGAVAGMAAILTLSLLLASFLEGVTANRFSVEAMLYGASSASSRASNLVVLANAWMNSPFALFAGLGFNSFSALPENVGDPYSHILFADAVFELGLPGTVLLGASLWTGGKSTYQLMRLGWNEPLIRASLAATSALIVYHIMLVNKQGSLWGVSPLFPLLAIMTRLWMYPESETDHMICDDGDGNQGLQR